MSTRIPVSKKTTRGFPNDVAIFSDRLIFTTLAERQVQTHSIVPYIHPVTQRPCTLLSVGDDMYYLAFAKDYGPLNLSYVFDACQTIHTQLTANPEVPVCVYTAPNPKSKSNMALMVALYCLVVERYCPWQAFGPIAEMELRPFRDAGPGPMEFGITVQDCLYGMDKAMNDGLLDLAEFDIKHYRWFEQVDNGDLNIIGPFIPFASPVDPLWASAAKATAFPTPENEAALSAVRNSRPKFPNHAFKCISRVFKQEEVGLVVRLNDELYDKRYFTEQGMHHVDLYFDDGSNPSDEIVRAFIRLAEEVIEKRKMKVAVHCKAGLGRTGVLIGAYFIYKYGFTAQEVIAFMRIVRPGMVVGPQQQYMVANQMKWVRWAARDSLMQELNLPSTSSVPCRGTPLPTPPLEDEPVYQAFRSSSARNETSTYRTPVEELKASTRHRSRPSTDVKAPIIATIGSDAIGQPRKGRKPVGMEDVIEVDESDSDQVTVNLGESASTSTAVSTLTSRSSVRGVKRGAGRAPVTSGSSSETTRTTVRATLEVPSASLVRSSSTSSMQSVVSEIDDRAHKRRPPGSPALRNDSTLRVSQSPSRSVSPHGSPLRQTEDHRERSALGPSRNMDNVAPTSNPVPETPNTKAPQLQRATRNAAEMTRPAQMTSPSSIPVPVPRRLLGRTRKSPVEDELAAPATPERAKTKSPARQGEVVRAGKQDLVKEVKEKEKKVTGSPRFGSRFFTRLGAGSA